MQLTALGPSSARWGARDRMNTLREAHVGASMAQVVNQGGPDISRQRQTVDTLGRTSDANDAFGPIKVIERQLDHLAGT